MNDLNLTVLQFKYAVASPEAILQEIKKDLITAYNNYCNPSTPNKNYNVLLYLSSRGEYFSQRIIDAMKEIQDNIELTEPEFFFNAIQQILGFIHESQKNNKERETIHQSFDNFLNKQISQGDRKMAKSKWEHVVNKRLATVLEHCAKRLQGLMGNSERLKGGPKAPIAREKSDQEKFMWRNTSKAAQQYGLNDPEVFRIVDEDIDLRDDLRKLINATKDVNARIPEYKNIRDAVARAKELINKTVVPKEASINKLLKKLLLKGCY